MLEKPLEPPRLPEVNYSAFKLQVLVGLMCHDFMYNVKYVELKQSDVCHKYIIVPTINLLYKLINSVHFD